MDLGEYTHCLNASDLAASIDFYAKLGFSIVEERGALNADEKPSRPRRDLDGHGGVDVRARISALDDTAKRDARTLMARVERASRARRAALDTAKETQAIVATRKAAVGMLVDEKRRFEADAVDVFDDVLGDSLLAASMTPVRTPVRRTQSEPVSRRGWFSFLRSPKTPAAPQDSCARNARISVEDSTASFRQ